MRHSRIHCQMMRVISSPSISTMGFATLILAITVLPGRESSRSLSRETAAGKRAGQARGAPVRNLSRGQALSGQAGGRAAQEQAVDRPKDRAEDRPKDRHRIA